MARETILIALGGNAIDPSSGRHTVDEQWENIDRTARQIARVALTGMGIVLTHGNGPQVGELLIQQEAARDSVIPRPLSACVAMTQGHIGWMLQNRLRIRLAECGLGVPVCTLVTQVLVSPEDPEFKRPSKPVGPWYSGDHVAKLQTQHGWTMKEMNPSAEKGWRRVVSSPEPLEIIESDALRLLVGAGCIVIASGGGGIPVIRAPGGIDSPIDAVIDKDRAGYVLARAVEADHFLILTDVERVLIGWGTSEEKPLSTLTLEEAERLCAEGRFHEGSMRPKVEAAMRFVRWKEREAVIGSLDRVAELLEGSSGTRIVPG